MLGVTARDAGNASWEIESLASLLVEMSMVMGVSMQETTIGWATAAKNKRYSGVPLSRIWAEQGQSQGRMGQREWKGRSTKCKMVQDGQRMGYICVPFVLDRPLHLCGLFPFFTLLILYSSKKKVEKNQIGREGALQSRWPSWIDNVLAICWNNHELPEWVHGVNIVFLYNFEAFRTLVCVGFWTAF